jgi:ornithine cyclodeaminase/alanine dehydrogenase-like protein (mu-crystallin family)
VRALLDVDALIDALAEAFADLSAGRASAPPRNAAQGPHGALAAMPGHAPGALAAKLVTLFPDAPHHALIARFDEADGTPLALMDGGEITALRTAAASAVAVRALAREDARVLAVVGTGVQGRSHADVVPRVRAFEEVRVAGRSEVEDAVSGADVVCLCTSAPEPVIDPSWIAPGAHVGSVGFLGELPRELVTAGHLVVESRVAFEPPPAGAVELQGIDPGSAAELGEVLPGRWHDELTVYKSTGHAVEDAVAARLVHEAAVAAGRGTVIDLDS